MHLNSCFRRSTWQRLLLLLLTHEFARGARARAPARGAKWIQVSWQTARKEVLLTCLRAVFLLGTRRSKHVGGALNQRESSCLQSFAATCDWSKRSRRPEALRSLGRVPHPLLSCTRRRRRCGYQISERGTASPLHYTFSGLNKLVFQLL